MDVAALLVIMDCCCCPPEPTDFERPLIETIEVPAELTEMAAVDMVGKGVTERVPPMDICLAEREAAAFAAVTLLLPKVGAFGLICLVNRLS